MTGTLDDRYFEWLYSQVAAVKNRNPSRSYWKLLRALYTRQFHIRIHNDENRADDGIDLRFEFMHEEGSADVDHTWMSLGCSVLEMLIALSRRLSFQSDSTAVGWFWKLIENLELSAYTDDIYEISIDEEVQEVLTRLNDRQYMSDGRGGLFPLRNPSQDQRRVEIWYQMASYLLESEYVHNGPRE